MEQKMCEDIMKYKRELVELKEQGYTHVAVYEDENKVLQLKGFKGDMGAGVWLMLTGTIGEVFEITV